MTGEPTAVLARARVCGHIRHVGTCAACQRAQLARWQAQLTQASAARMYQTPSRTALAWSATPPIGQPRS